MFLFSLFYKSAFIALLHILEPIKLLDQTLKNIKDFGSSVY